MDKGLLEQIFKETTMQMAMEIIVILAAIQEGVFIQTTTGMS